MICSKTYGEDIQRKKVTALKTPGYCWQLLRDSVMQVRIDRAVHTTGITDNEDKISLAHHATD
jgi:hypothetical protein